MVYLDNKKDPQEVWIPRNDGNGSTHSGSSHSYEEGYADGVNDQKAKLASTAFTENGDYQRNDGWSAITVNVPQSGSVLEGKEIVVSQDVTIVVPTSGYDGFSAVTVDATEYGQTNYDSGFEDGYTDGYSSGSSEGYDSGYTEGYNSGYTSGETDGYNSGYTSGETHQKSLLGNTAFTINGSYSAENGYSAITVNVPQTGSTSVLGVGSFSANGTYSASTDSLDGYSAITVNVPQTTYTIEDTKAVNVSFTNTPIVVTPTKNNIQVTEIIPNKKFSLNASGFSGINYNLYLGCFRDTSINDRYAGNSVIYNGYNFNIDTKYSDYPFTATTEGGGTILTIEFLYPTFEWIGNGDGSEYDLLSATTICFKPDVSSISVFVDMSSYVQDVYAYQYGVDYLKGVVVSCENLVNSARTEAQNAIISTFTAATATTNGVYGSSANPLSSITVNVPQTGHTEQEMEDAYDSGYTSGYTDGYNSGYTSGYTDGQSAGSGYTINQLASRQYGITDPTINVDVEPYAFCESKASASVLNGHLTIGSGCTSIGIAAFFNSFITSVTFTNENTIRFVGDSNFSLSRIQGELELPQNIELNTASTVNSNGAFGGCHYITSLIAKCSVITPKCFSSCNRLNTLELHNVSSIGGYAFDSCSALTSIKIYDKVPSIDNSRSPFLNVASSGTVHYESGLNVSTWQNNTDISGWTFVGDL